MANFWGEYPFLVDELEKVKNIIIKKIKNSDKTIEDALTEVFEKSGKMLRPAFVILSAHFGEYKSEKILNIAAAVEMFHNATLIHDDILDNSIFRRNIKTVQSKYGQNYAVIIGDFLLARCIGLLTNCEKIDVLKDTVSSMERLCIGEIHQFNIKGKTDVSIYSYLKRIAAKTAVLFALSFYIGAIESDCDEKMANNLRKIGFNIGMAFQIKDDILDMIGEEETIGKKVGNDIKEGIYTLPILYVIKEDGRLNELISKSNLSEIDINNVIKITREKGGIYKAEILADRYTNKALKLIEKLPEIESKTILKESAIKLLMRNY